MYFCVYMYTHIIYPMIKHILSIQFSNHAPLYFSKELKIYIHKKPALGYLYQLYS